MRRYLLTDNQINLNYFNYYKFLFYTKFNDFFGLFKYIYEDSIYIVFVGFFIIILTIFIIIFFKLNSYINNYNYYIFSRNYNNFLNVF